MKCPKCGYLGFEDSERCRNCGFEFSLSLSLPNLADASIHHALEAEGPNLDLALGETIPAPGVVKGGAFDLKGIVDAAAPGTTELPLFGEDAGISSPPRISGPPRAPLAVRRATPEVPKARTRTPRPAVDALDLVGLSDVRAMQPAATPVRPEPAAPLSSRIGAALLDAAIMAGVDSAIVYFTLRLCTLQPDQWGRLPAIPLLAFLAIVNGGYFVAFTAVGGQSIGKMALGIRVVGQEKPAVSLAHASVRVLVGLASILPLGLGLLAGLVGPDRRPLHDRFAHTRVIKPSSI
jgi:uncharacterized RDD family membrane protein YckC